MRKTAIGIGATATAGVGLSGRGPAPAVGSAEAVAPLIGAGAIGGAALVGWAAREYEVVGSNPPAEGLTADVLRKDVYQTARTRQSTNASTFVDNQTIADQSEQPAYAEAKKRAIEAINNGFTESEVETAAKDEADAYFTTIQKNFLRSWNESISEFYTFRQSIVDHPELTESDILSSNGNNSSQDDSFDKFLSMDTRTVNLIDGSAMDVNRLRIQTAFSTYEYEVAGDPVDPDQESNAQDADVIVSHYDTDLDDPLTYHDTGEWGSAHNSIETAQSNVHTSLETWVPNAYSGVEQGTIDTTDLITPSQRASMLADQDGNAMAIADLAALNIPVDVGRQITLTFGETGATLTGRLALTDESDGPIASGNTYNPSDFSGDVYFATDTSLVGGDWDSFDDTVTDGNVTLTSEPYEGTVYDIQTTDGTVSVDAGDFTNSINEWTYNVTGEIPDGSSVTDVSYRSDTDEEKIETLKLDAAFTVDSITDTETGESDDSLNFSSSEPQDDNNYITDEEWQQLQQENQELIEKYEESQSTGGAGGFLNGDVSDIRTLGIVAGGAALAALLFGNN